MKPWSISKYKSLINDYTELRAHENRSLVIALLNGKMTLNTSSSEQGISARKYGNGSWGFASHPQIDKLNVEKVIKEASENAQFMQKRSRSDSHLAKVQASKLTIDLSTKKEKFTRAALIDRLKELDSYIESTFKDLSHREVRCLQQDFLKEGINSENAETYSHYARSYVFLTMGLPSSTGPVELRTVLGDKGEIEDTIPSLEYFKTKANETYKLLKDKSQAVAASGGLKEVILSSKLAGILAHEAIGHTTEADIVLGGSIAGSYLEKQVASPKISLVDFAHTAFGKQAPMPVLFDDEGTEAEDTVIIKDGVLKTFMNSKETAAHFHQKATGHARAWGFNDEPLIRMRNTAILPGTDKLENMISSIEDGYYLLDHSNGQADSTSEFMFGVTMGYEIKNGKLGRAIHDTTISGVAFDMLKTATMVSDEMTWVSAGTCGKKQPMTVGMGGPAIKCKINLGGH